MQPTSSRTVAFAIFAVVIGVVSPLTTSLAADEHEARVARWKADFDSKVLPVIRDRCLACHNAEKSEGELNLARFATGEQAYEAGDAWERVARRIRLNEMPPQGSPGLNDQQKGVFQRWVDNRPNQDLCRQLASEDTQSWYRGYVMSRRLTRIEYRNAIRDLLGVIPPVLEQPPEDGGGGEGFDTVGDALFTSTIHVETWLVLADQLVDQALPVDTNGRPRPTPILQTLLSPQSWQHLTDGSPEQQSRAASELLERFARRAWRRPPEPTELERLAALRQQALLQSGPLAAVRQTLKAILVSPHFLFVVETEPDETGIFPLTPHQLATRLALFLWSSIPDEELMQAADTGELADETAYRRQIARMLAHPKATSLGENFGLQWLGLRNFENQRPDSQLFPEYTPELANDLREEAVQLITSVFRDNRPLSDLLSADYVIVNSRLASHYGLPLPAESGWQKVTVSDRRRGGVATLGAVLTVASYPRRTSPVLRGRWLLDELLGNPVPPPPPGVPPLEQATADNAHLSLRQRLEAHRSKPECAACHDRMDPLGFGLENFDPIGRWRDADGGLPIDAVGKLPSGEQFSGPAELKTVLLSRQQDFLTHLSRKLLGFALGRELNKFDACVIESCVKRLHENGLQSRVLIEEIARSYPFRNRYYKKSEPTPAPPESRSTRFLNALQKFAEKSAAVRKQNEASRQPPTPPQPDPEVRKP
ncbi:MAG: DUF1592 domain-containing protein [Planctomycetota bacterium]